MVTYARPSAIGLEGGGTFVAYTQNSAQQIISGRLIDLLGRPFGGQLRISDVSRQRVDTAEAVALSGGGFAVVWPIRLDFQRDFFGNFVINQPAGVQIKFFGPIASDPTSNLFVAQNAAEPIPVLSNVEDPGGPTAFKLPFLYENVQATELVDGSVAVTWSLTNVATGEKTTQYRRVSPDDTTGTGIVDLSFGGNDEVGGVKIEALTNGGFALLYGKLGGNVQSGAVEMQLFDKDGLATSGAIEVNAPSTFDVDSNSGAELIVLEDGRIAVVWIRQFNEVLEQGEPRISDKEMLYRIFSDDGTALGAPTRIEYDQVDPSVEVVIDGRVRDLSGFRGVSDGRSPDIIALPGGGFAVTYVGQTYPAPSTDSIGGINNAAIIFQQFDEQGIPVAPARSLTPFNDGRLSLNRADPDLALLADGSVVVAFAENNLPQPGGSGDQVLALDTVNGRIFTMAYRFVTASELFPDGVPESLEPIDPADLPAPADPIDQPAPVDPVEPPAPIGPTAGDDLLSGTAQNDTIKALGGNDTVDGLTGDDLLRGGSGNDNIKGSGGDDRLIGNGGDDTLKGGGGDDNIKGNGGDDNIKGNGGSDVIKAGGGDDTVKGGGGADVINGGGGSDLLQGGGGNDTITGKGGDDTLKGNGGADVFQFRASDRNDTILDFRQGQDLIEIQTGANSFAGLSIEQDGRDVLIGFGAGQVRVVTDSVGAFDESDFIF